MELHREALQVRVIHALAAAVIRVLEGLDADSLQGIRDHRVTVVLGGDIGPSGVQVPHRLVAAAVAVLELDRVSAQRQASS